MSNIPSNMLRRVVGNLPKVETADQAMWHTLSSEPQTVVGSGSAEFNGTSSIIQINDFDEFQGNGGTNFSAFTWVKAKTIGVNHYLGGHFDTAGQRSWDIVITAANQLGVFVSGGGDYPTASKYYYTTQTLSANKWYHVGFTWNSGTFTLYLDGKEQPVIKVTDNVVTTLHNSTAPLTIGGITTGGSPSLFSNVKLSDWHFYSDTLTESEIQNVMSKSYADLTASEKTNLVSWYELETDSQDSHGTNHGTDTAITYVDDTPSFRQLTDSSPEGNNALLYTGRGMSGSVNDTISIGDVSTFDFERTDAFSTSFYVKTTTTSASVIFGKMDNSANRGWAVFSAISGGLHLVLRNTNNTNEIKITSSAVNDGNWHHIVITYDGSSSASGITVYIDGVYDSLTTDTDNLSATIVTNASMEILSRNAADLYWTGSISNLIIYDIELTSAQAAELYANPEQVIPTGATFANLVGHWPLTEGPVGGTPPIVLDASGNNNHGTPAGVTQIGALPQPTTQWALKGHNHPMFFDGSNDCISIPSVLNLSNDFTIIVNVFTNSLATTQYIISQISGTKRFQLQILNGIIRAGLYDSVGPTQYGGKSGSYVPGICQIVYISSSGTYSLYVNNSSKVGVTDPSGYFNANYIGGSSSSTMGIIYNAAFYDSVLTTNELTEIYNGGINFDLTTDSGDYASSANLQGYWKNTGNTNADWVDLSGNGNNGTVNGSPDTIFIPEGLTSGQDALGATIINPNNGELLLDGAGYALVADDNSLDFGTGDFTIECWAKGEYVSLGSSVNCLFAKDTAAVPDWGLYINNSNQFEFRGNGLTGPTSTTLSDGEWHHIVAVRNSGTVTLYIDSVAEGTPAAYATTVSTTKPIYIGRDGAASRTFNGQVDEPKVYGAALTPTQIRTNYLAQKPKHI